ncbi:MAG TPA: permease, partial [Thermoguttaceae bacterium]|nr:permease [Thermoguttaceae bacterium]
MIDIISKTLWEAWFVLGEMSVYLLFGFLMAGVLSVCISPALVERHLGRGGLWPVLKASLFGVPLPLCSCSVIPVSASIRRHGASRGATTAFLLSTPQTGVDSIAITYALLGPVFAVFRPIAAFATGLFGGYLVQLVDDRDEANPSNSSTENTCAEPCCSGTGSRGVVGRALRYGLVTLPRDLGPALLLGVLIAGAMAAL